MTAPVLYIGDHAYSSWSMRAWLALTVAEIAFETRLVRLDTPESGREISAVSPARTVPALHAGDLVIWDSLAICEWAAEQAPALWPADPARRAVARALSASMHSDFWAFREAAPMDLHREGAPKLMPPPAAHDALELARLWRIALEASGGPYLAGAWSIADAMATPYATRYRAYAVTAEPLAQVYIDAVLETPAFTAWRAAAHADPRRLAV